MFTSFKSQIVVQTLAPFVIVFTTFCLILSGVPFEQIIEDWSKLVAITAMAIGLGLLQDLIPKPVKEALIFWRIRNRRSGHRAFSKERKFSSILRRDEVVDISIRENLAPMYQDRLFYEIYDRFRDKGNVKHSSYRYLQWRELSAVILVSGIIGGVFIGATRGFLSQELLITSASSAILLCLTVLAARNSSENLIDYVLLNERLDQNG